VNEVLQKYQDWSARQYKTIACTKDTGARAAFNPLVDMKFTTLSECERHVQRLIRLCSTLLESRTNLRWVEKLKEDSELWSEILEVEIMHGGLAIDEVVDGLIHGRLVTERAIDLVR